MNKFYLSLIIIFFNFSPITYATTVIHAGLLIDGESSVPSSEMSIVIEGSKIESIEVGFITPDSDDKYIDLSGYTVLPGLIDMHVHLGSEYNKNSFQEKITLNSGDYAIRAVANAEKTLKAGFTTVRNLGDSDGVTISLRNAIKKGIVSGPRIFSSGTTIASSGGHGDSTNSLNKSLTSDPGPARGIVNNVDDASKAVRYRYKEGADLIKITATGGVLSNAKNSKNPQLTEEEITRIVNIANDYGFKVAAHAHGAEGIKRAVRSGVHSIEHGSLMDVEGMKLMRERGTYYVPTIIAGLWVSEKAKEKDFFPELVRPKAAEIGPKIKDTFGRAYQAGVKIAFGTDTGVSEHGKNAAEFRHMVEAGMPPMKAIQSATLEAAKLLGEQHNLGSLIRGKTADIIAVSGNPLEDISILEEVDFVMKEGEVYKGP
ncbi:MAG TPA: amidohydrolase family protein [Gammaproteobacteria bacterium]|nr:amidohydrolase family protein [Gammaproteobacteria bacterium]